MSHALLVDLQARGLVAQMTDHSGMATRLASPLTVYGGFDPTADSLHVGHLVPVLTLARMQRAGHRPLLLVGGATGMIGDPSGKSDARRMLTREDILANTAALKTQLSRLIVLGDGPGDARLVDNADWFGGMGWIEMMRTVAPHFSVNRMLTMDSVKGRLESGISYLEFSYMIMQAYDFVHLYRTQGCTLQVGGQEQWGNIVMGIELGRRTADADLAGLTLPLVTKSDGTKFGKTESGAVWLDPQRTSVHQFYQFWRNVADADVRRYLLQFTTVAVDDIERRTTDGGAALNEAKELLAWEVTRIVHGEGAADGARDSARRAFGAGDVGGDAIPHGPVTEAELAAGIAVVALLKRAGFAQSNGEARRLIEGRGVSLNDNLVEDPARLASTADLVEHRLVLRAGKKRLYRFDLAAGG
jgi:tyrosyl-tRNA synthetase